MCLLCDFQELKFIATKKLFQNRIHKLIVKHGWKILNLLCCLAFTWQLSGIVDEWINTVQKTTVMMEKKLQDMKFPIIFKICMKPGFNVTALKEEGYKNIYSYFYGLSRYNSSLYGWAGHTNTSKTRSTVDAIYQKVQNYLKVEKAVKK